jgi:hypothetical protein
VLKETLSDITRKIEQIKEKGIAKDKLLLIANGLEKEFLEAKYGEILKTDDIEYKTLMQEIVHDTQKHQIRIIYKINETKERESSSES